MDYNEASSEKAREERRRNRQIKPLTNTPPKKQKSVPAMDILKSFIKTDVKEIRRSLVDDVLKPRAIDLLSDSIDTAKNLALYGDPRKSRTSKSKKESSVTSYDEYYRNEGRSSSGSAYRVGKFDVDIYPIESRDEAVDILNHLKEDLVDYTFVSVADYYMYLGVPDERIEAVHHNYGWRNLDFVQVISNRHGYIIDLPKAEKYKED